MRASASRRAINKATIQAARGNSGNINLRAENRGHSRLRRR
jgi:hypothetical protein